MFIVEASSEIGVRPDQAFAWVSDLANLPKWQSGIFRSDVLTPPPVRVGTRFRETFRLLGFPIRAECEVVEMTPPRTFGFRATGNQMNFESRFVFEPAPRGTRISHKATVTMRGLWKVLGPLLKAEANREAEANTRG